MLQRFTADQSVCSATAPDGVSVKSTFGLQSAMTGKMFACVVERKTVREAV